MLRRGRPQIRLSAFEEECSSTGVAMKSLKPNSAAIRDIAERLRSELALGAIRWQRGDSYVWKGR